MSWREAPVYVQAYDLAVWVQERAKEGHPLSPSLRAGAQDLVEELALALTFPATRARHLLAADEAIVRFRLRLRLARDAGLVSAGGHRYACGRLREIGRMVGGWRKHQHQARAPP